ncbi:MAG TPA: VOC family protein [Alphaproteobacteria bacterium]|nr:VOC family protein [Alphaproteobacteria bacterium]
MEQRLSLITLGVADLARSRRFYESGLGWTPSAASQDDVVFFQLGGIALSLYPRPLLAEDARLADAGPAPFGGIALAYNARTKAEVDAVLAKAVAAGAALLKPAQDAFWGGYSGYFADPDGHPWEVAWNPGFPIAEDGSVRLP